MESITRQDAQTLGREVEEALRAVAERHGLTVEVRGGTYDSGFFKPRVEFKTAGSDDPVRFFGGVSFPLGGRVRAGLSARGTPWLGARGGSGPLYFGALLSPKRRRARREAERAGDVVLGDVLGIDAERTSDGGAVLAIEFADGTMRVELGPELADELFRSL